MVGKNPGFISSVYAPLLVVPAKKFEIDELKNPTIKGIATLIMNFFTSFVDIINTPTPFYILYLINKYVQIHRIIT